MPHSTAPLCEIAVFFAVYGIRVDDAEFSSYRVCPGAPLVHPVIESDVTPFWGVKNCCDALTSHNDKKLSTQSPYKAFFIPHTPPHLCYHTGARE